MAPMKTSARPFTSTQWQPAERLGQLSVDSRVRPWIIDNRLLTERMRSVCGARFVLQVAGNWSGDLTGEHKSALRVEDAHGLFRDIEMRCGDKVWVYGRTIVPDSTLSQHSWLAELGDAALSETLGGLSDVERSAYEYAWLPRGDEVCECALRGAEIMPAGLWARRAKITIRSAALLSQELFLPSMGSL
jgi:chorismate--pyruvate lyase